MSRLVQLRRVDMRRLAIVDEPRLRLLMGVETLYGLAREAVSTGLPLELVMRKYLSDESLDYDAVYAGASPWRLLAPIDHPDEPTRCLVSGTGLTHLGSASHRQAMHGRHESDLTDSMRMFRAGLAGGRPAPGCIGAAPEWFFKGSGTALRAPGEPLVVPSFGQDGSTPFAGGWRSSATGQRSGRSPLPPARPRCATAARTSSITTSSSMRIDDLGTCTCTTTARTV